jgi:hypothetical protein
MMDATGLFGHSGRRQNPKKDLPAFSIFRLQLMKGRSFFDDGTA